MKKTVYFIPTVLWFVLIYLLLTIPGDELPAMDFLDKIYFDKWVHIGLFAMQVYLCCVAFKNTHSLQASVFIKAALAAWLYGIAMEFVQKYCVVNRSFDVTDIIADGVGCFLGYYFFTKRYKKPVSGKARQNT